MEPPTSSCRPLDENSQGKPNHHFESHLNDSHPRLVTYLGCDPRSTEKGTRTLTSLQTLDSKSSVATKFHHFGLNILAQCVLECQIHLEPSRIFGPVEPAVCDLSGGVLFFYVMP